MRCGEIANTTFIVFRSKRHRGRWCTNNTVEYTRRVWRYQRANQNPYIEEQTTQWPKEKSAKGKTTIYKTLHRKLKIEQHKPFKNWGWSRVLRKGNQFLLHIWDHHATLVTDRVISQEWGKDRIVITKNKIYIHDWHENLRHKCSVAVNQVMVSTAELLKCWRMN